MKVIKFLHLLVPPIFYPKTINKIIRYFIKLFYKDPQTILPFEKTFYSRHAFVNKAINQFSDCMYLEIGVNQNDVFNSIPLSLSKKFGVDPFQGGNYRMTSDEFFKKYTNLKFDVIFIDGLHEYSACQSDVINSIKALNKDGIILIDDLLPKNKFEEGSPRKQDHWTGDIWKVAVEINNSKNCDFKIVNIDTGIGILKINDNFEYKKMPELKNKTFDDYLKYYKEFKIIKSDEAFNFISKSKI
jgi:hypothetical protein